MTRIAVVGSINMDLVAVTKRRPLPGETVTGDEFFTVPGGKGLNQAVAAAKAGADVSLLGAVGSDGFGAEVVAALAGLGVPTGGITHQPGAPASPTLSWMVMPETPSSSFPAQMGS